MASRLSLYVFKTYRLDLVEFTPLPDAAGVQMLWRNPRGFNTNSGEYVKIKLPWLSKGGKEWHPFSIYLKEGTEKGEARKVYHYNIELFPLLYVGVLNILSFLSHSLTCRA